MDSEWDDNELVGLDDIRPSKRVYGPAASAKGRNAQRPTRRSNPQNDRPAQRQPSQARNSQARTSQPRSQQGSQEQVRRGEPRPRPDRQQARGDRPAPRSQSRVQPGRQGQAPRTQARQTQGRVGQRQPRDRFANDLAQANRQQSPPVATSGWRGALSKATGGVLNVGPSGQDRAFADLNRQIRRPVTDGTVAVFSRKGGVGKTTISAYLGLTLANERGGRIVALDGDAEAGSLGWLLAPKAPSTLAALASAIPMPTDYAGIRRYTASTPEGLEVIVGDPAETGPISAVGLEALADQLARHYDLSIFDTGAGVTRATGRVLVTRARTLLLVMSPSIDSVRAAERTLAWLDERPGEAANENVNVIAVINGIPSSTKRMHIERIESHFNERCNAVVRIPWDQHLATGSSQVSLDLLAKATRDAFVELAATTVGSLARRPRSNRELATSGARYAS